MRMQACGRLRAHASGQAAVHRCAAVSRTHKHSGVAALVKPTYLELNDVRVAVGLPGVRRFRREISVVKRFRYYVLVNAVPLQEFDGDMFFRIPVLIQMDEAERPA